MSTTLITVDIWKSIEAPYSAFLGCLIAILGSGIFTLCERHTVEQQHDFFISVSFWFRYTGKIWLTHGPQARRRIVVAMISLAALGYVVVVISQNYGSNSSDSDSTWRQSSDLSTSCPDRCVPKPSTPQTIANYSQFNNVLLVVFFSHARYDSNLDFHK